MKHRVGYNRLGRKPAHRKSLHRNMVSSLFKHERIRTTKAKAREIRRTAEKMITRAKVDSVHNRRMVARDIKDEAILAKLFTDIAPRFVKRPGGYTRMLKIGQRNGDASEMVLLELVDEEVVESAPAKKSGGRRAKAEKTRAKPAASETKSAKADGAGAEAAETEAEPADEETKASDAQGDSAPGDDESDSTDESDSKE